MPEEMLTVSNREWIMTAYAEHGLPTAEHVALRASKLLLPASDADSYQLPDGHVLVKVLSVSVDPYMRSRMWDHRRDGLCFEPYQLDQVIVAIGAGRIIRSKEDAQFTEGDLVICRECPVAEYCVLPTDNLWKVDTSPKISLSAYLNAFGIPGFAAWIGLGIGNPKPGENVFISAAAGAVGMIAGQLAKLRGCRVVGSTGTDEKVKFLKEELKFDDAFNYNKETDIDAALGKYLPNGIDVYFDNVGGKMLEAVLNHVNIQARIPLCGMISQYNQVWTDSHGVRNLLNIVGKEVSMQGFMISNHNDKFGKFVQELKGYLEEEKLILKVQTCSGIENFLESFVSIFSSSNLGKIIVKISD